MRVCCTTAGRGGVAFYRIIQPYTYISQFVDVFICDPAVHHKQRIDDEMEAADVIVFQMPFGEHYYKEIMKNKQRIKPKKIILEFDDNIFHIHPLNTAYKAYGQEEVLKYYALGEDIDKAEAHIVSSGMNLKVERFKPGEMEIEGRSIAGCVELHKDGVDGFDLKANQLRMAYTIKSVMEADMVTCTVEHLGKQFRKYRKGPIAILPNFVDCDRFLEMKKHGTDEIRIGWQGGSAHFQDLHMIREVMWQIMDKYPNVKFVIQGAGFTGIFPDKYKDRVEWKPWHSDVNTFPLATRDLACDIGICPVIDDNFNRSKSELKFLEFSAMKVPTVCSHVTYWHAVKHAKTGFLAKNNKEWFEYLCELIEKPELRKQMGEKAYDRIKGYHNVDQSIMWLDMLNDLTGKIIKPVL